MNADEEAGRALGAALSLAKPKMPTLCDLK